MSLKDLLIRQINQTGPISVADFMATCLLHPEHGYYTTRTPFGAAGDFVTAPEISQMFGELIGLSLAQAWLDQGAPRRFALAELGPGRGTLMADILRTGAQVPGFTEAADVTLIEASERLRAVQAETLSGAQPIWLDRSDALPETPLFLIANEFFDALPVRQFFRSGAAWRERQIGTRAEELIFGLGPEQPQPGLAHRLEDTREGDLVEDCPAAAPLLAPIAQRISTQGGCALIIDYGDWRSLGDTLQAVRDHKPVPPLDNPGLADLTAHVDFEALAAVASPPCTVSKLTPQGVFLERLGITARAQTLANNLSGAALDTHIAAHRRLTHPQEMGNLFKVMGLCPEGCALPPGLDV